MLIGTGRKIVYVGEGKSFDKTRRTKGVKDEKIGG